MVISNCYRPTFPAFASASFKTHLQARSSRHWSLLCVGGAAETADSRGRRPFPCQLSRNPFPGSTRRPRHQPPTRCNFYQATIAFALSLSLSRRAGIMGSLFTTRELNIKRRERPSRDGAGVRGGGGVGRGERLFADLINGGGAAARPRVMLYIVSERSGRSSGERRGEQRERWRGND